MNITPIGQYIIREAPDAREQVQRALQIQSELFREGDYIIGQILIEKGWISEDFLNRCLLRQREDCLREIELFESLPPEALQGLARQSNHVLVAANSIIFRQLDVGDIYFLIISGEVVVTRSAEGGEETAVARLGPGEGFGEIALLTGRSRNATVTAVTKTVLIAVPKPAFDFVLATDPMVSQVFIRVLAERLSQGNERLVQLRADESAYRQFISEQAEKQEPRLAGSSLLIRRVFAEIDRAASHNKPVLVYGETGTELWDAAALIHRKRSGNAGIFTLDAKRTGYAGADHSIEKTDPLATEIAHMSSLFGRSNDALPLAEGRRIGLLQLAEKGTVVIDHVDALPLSVQERLADFLRAGRYKPLGEKASQFSSARIICTTTRDLSLLADQGVFSGDLASVLLKETVSIPALKKRKRDIREVVGQLLLGCARQLGRSAQTLDEDAYKAIMAYDWPGNIDELSVVIRRAVMLSQGDTLRAEHIFIGPPPVTGRAAFDLFGLERIKGLFLSIKYPSFIQAAVAPFIWLIILLGLAGPQDPNRNAILVLTWGYWEPLIVIGSFVFARAWCSACPLGPFGYFVGRSIGLNKKVPNFIRKYGIYAIASGILLIFWVESATSMTSSPRATGMLVLVIGLLAIATGYVFERRTWCRYLCPLGGMIGFLSNCSMIELRSNYNICNTSCMKHDCYSGNDKGPGCPVFEGPFSLRSNQDCVLCGNCIKNCPNNSPVLNLRVPGQGLWSSLKIERSAVVIGAAMLGSQVFRGFEKLGSFHVLESSRFWPFHAFALITAITAGVIFFAALSARHFSSRHERHELGASGVIYCLIPLSVAFEVNFHLARLLTTGGTLLTVLGRQTGLISGLPSFFAVPSGIKLLQVLILLLGSAGSVKIAASLSRRANSNKIMFLNPVLFTWLLYVILFIAA